ncbi:beta strand repeat-containing protein [Haloferula sargassicola]
MKTHGLSVSTATSRRSLLTTAATTTLLLAGSAIISPVNADQFWDGDAGIDWNTPANWTNDTLPAAQWAVINIPGPNVATILADSVFTPSDIIIGNGAAGRLDHRAGTASTGPGNWFSVGFNGAGSGGVGTYNLADTAATGGTLTGFGTGSGSMTAQSNFMIGRTGGMGTVNVNTTGALNISADLRIVDDGNNSSGVFNLDAGTVSVGGSVQLSKVSGGTGELNIGGGALSCRELRVGYNGATGTVNLTGGSITTNNWTTFGGGGSTGNLNISGGTFTSNNDALIIGDNGTSTFEQTGGDLVVNGELMVGQGSGNGTENFSAGTMKTNNWVSIGRQGGTGAFTMSGGTWNHTAGGQHIVVGATGPGTLNLTGGQLNLATAGLEVGENNTAEVNVSGSAEISAGAIRVGLNNGASGVLSLDGGTIRTHRLSGQNRGGSPGEGTSEVHFNGTQLIATADDPGFLTSIDTAEIEAGGLLIDTDGYVVSGDQDLTGAGGVVKSGEGSASLLGVLEYTGDNLIEAGKLVLPNDSSGTGDIQVNDGGSLGIAEVLRDFSFSPTDVTFDAASSLDFNYNDAGASISTSPMIDVTGTLSLGGDLTINISDPDPKTGMLPLVSYASKTGAGDAVLGSLPVNVTASLQDSGSLISLNITSTSALAWDGDTAVWNFSATNWYDEETSSDNAPYADGRWVNFDDGATGTTDITLDVAVSPAGVLFENDLLDYSITGTGSIGGDARLVKQGGGSVILGTPNTFTGTTSIEEGVLEILSIANGGQPSPLGQSAAAPENLRLAGGALVYSGAAASSDRGVQVDEPGSAIGVVDQLTLSGTFLSSTGSTLAKTGAGNLILAPTGANTYGSTGLGELGGFEVQEGTLTLTGSGSHAMMGQFQIGTVPDVSVDLVLDDATLTTSDWFSVGRGNGTGAVATVTATDSDITTTNFVTGYQGANTVNECSQIVTLNGTTTWETTDLFRLGESAGSTSVMTLNDSSAFLVSGTNDVQFGLVGSGTLNINDSASFRSSGWLSLGRYDVAAIGTINVNGGVLENINPARHIIVGESGIGVLNIAGGSVSDVGDQTNLGQFADADGTINLMAGGTMTTHRLFGGEGASAFHFDGGTLVAGAANGDFLTVDTATVSANGGTIDTNGFDVTVAQVFSGEGGLTKTGVGTLTLDGASAMAGTTVVSQGVLGGNGSLSGGLQVDAGASVNPGSSAGTLAAGNTVIAGTYRCEIDGSAADRLNVTGTLTVTGATLDFDELSAPTGPVYVIASYTSLVGTFSEVDVPAGYSVDYHYQGANQIALVGGGATPYDTWAASFGLNPATDGAIGADPDGDGQPNNIEFGFGGDPTDGGSNALIFALQADSDDAGTEPELVMTVAVRSGTPAFTAGNPATASVEGFTYSVEGSAALSAFDIGVTPIAPVTTGLPTAPSGYEYRSFRLDGSDGLPSRGFLRATINP